MKGLVHFISACSICLVSSHTPSFAGAWSQQKGHYYAKFSGIYYTSDERYNDMGRRDELGQDDDEFRSTQGFLYVEYGVADRLTTVAQFQGGRLVNENALIRQTTVGTGDVDLGLKYQWIDAPVVLAPFVTAKIPGGYDQKYEPPLGTGDADLEFRVLAAKSFHPWPLYMGAEVGYRLRGGPFSNQVPYLVEVGSQFREGMFAKIYVNGTQTRSKTENLGLVGAGVQVSEGDFAKLGLNLAFQTVGSIWVDVLWESVFDGNNVGAGATWGLGISTIQ